MCHIGSWQKNFPDTEKTLCKKKIRVLDEISRMSEYQWKLTIVERNLVLPNWMKLMADAQEQMLEEADELIGYLPLPDRQGLVTLLTTLQDHLEEDFQQKIIQILNNHSNDELRNSVELSVLKNNLSADVLPMNSSPWMQSVG